MFKDGVTVTHVQKHEVDYDRLEQLSEKVADDLIRVVTTYMVFDTIRKIITK